MEELEYEDIDLGRLSEVTKEEFDLAKLEAEGWVTEVVIADESGEYPATEFMLGVAASEVLQDPIVAITVDNQPVEFKVEVDDIPLDGKYYSSVQVYHNMPNGAIVKIYHQPNVKKLDLFLTISGDGGFTVVDLYKCVKNAASFGCDYLGTCYSLPLDLEKLEIFGDCGRIVPKIPASVSYFYCSSFVDYTVVHFEAIPSVIEINSDCTMYVPYHLLDEAKNMHPDYAQYFDAIVPASHINELVESIENGDTIVGKAKCDQHGNVIDTSYLRSYGTIADLEIESSSYTTSTARNKFINGAIYTITLWYYVDGDKIRCKAWNGVMTYDDSCDEIFVGLSEGRSIMVVPNLDVVHFNCSNEDTLWTMPYGGLLEIRRIL